MSKEEATPSMQDEKTSMNPSPVDLTTLPLWLVADAHDLLMCSYEGYGHLVATRTRELGRALGIREQHGGRRCVHRALRCCRLSVLIT